MRRLTVLAVLTGSVHVSASSGVSLSLGDVVLQRTDLHTGVGDLPPTPSRGPGGQSALQLLPVVGLVDVFLPLLPSCGRQLGTDGPVVPLLVANLGGGVLQHLTTLPQSQSAHPPHLQIVLRVDEAALQLSPLVRVRSVGVEQRRHFGELPELHAEKIRREYRDRVPPG